MKYYYVASGFGGRKYDDLFFNLGSAFVGGESPINIMKKINIGDRIALKRGQTIVGAGEVVEEYRKYDWLNYDGWELKALCRVEWKKITKEQNSHFPFRGTIGNIKKDQYYKQIDDIILNGESVKSCHPEELKKILIEPSKISDDEILRFLISEGLRVSNVDDLVKTIKKIRLLAEYYYNECELGKEVKEHETRTFLVIPLLLALGWSEQQIKIELSCKTGQKVDIACFPNKYRDKKDCIMIIETKGFSSGLDYASSQAASYANSFPKCKILMVTNGHCYKVYKKDGNTFRTIADAYLNLIEPRERHPFSINMKGAKDAIKYLLPHNF